MPPRQYVPSTWAGQTRSCRSAPMRPISSWVWTAPGRSTMTTRPVSSAVIGGTGRAWAVLPDQSPRVSASRASRSMPVRSPTMTAVAVAGRMWASKKARTAAASIRRTVSSVPRRGRDIRAVAGKSSLESCLAARRAGLACSCGISSRRLPTSRSISLSAKAGARRASATRPSALASREAGTSRETRTPGWSACASRVAPQRSSSAANSSARVLVGALGERARHDRGHAVQALGLGVQRRVQEDLHGHDLLAGAVAAQHGQPVGQGAALGRGERPGPGGARGRLRVVLHGYSSHGGVAHLSAPSGASVASSASSAGSMGS